MKKTPFLAVFRIIQNHFRIFLNWQAYGDNKVFILLLLVSITPVIIYFSAYFGDQSSLNAQLASVMIAIFVPILVSKYYFKLLLKEKYFLENYFTGKEISTFYLILIQLCSFGIFILLLLLGVVPHLTNINNGWLILIIVLMLFLYNLFFPLWSKGQGLKSSGKKSNNLWNSSVHSIKMLPIRAIVNREILYNWRINKTYLLKGGLSPLFINVFIVFFIINNNYDNIFNIVVLLQYFLILIFIMQYPVSNDFQLIKIFPYANYFVIAGQFIFFTILSILYLVLFISVILIFLVNPSFLFLLISFIGFLILLLYVLLVKQAYLDNQITRYLIYFMMLLPITIPLISISCIRRLRC